MKIDQTVEAQDCTTYVRNKMIVANNPIGTRLKFHVDYFDERDVRIIIGLPTTVCQIWEPDSYQVIAQGFSIYNPADIYNWRTGVKIALGHALDAYDQTFYRCNSDVRRYYYEQMFKAYPELRQAHG